MITSPLSRIASVLAGALLFSSCVASFAQGAPREPGPRGPADPRRGPWNSDLLLFRSKDGEVFGQSKTFTERGGVPCVILDSKGHLRAVFQWFPFERREAFDRVATMVSEDHGETWTKPEPIAMEGLPEGAQRPFDPTLVLLDDGKLRLYFTCTLPERQTPGIYSAISDDGTHFRFEPGMRFGVEGEKVVDPAVTKFGKTWHLFSPMEPHLYREERPSTENRGERRPPPSQLTKGYHAISDDGLQFRRVDDVSVPVRGSWIGNVIAHGEQLHFYGSGADQGWLAHSPDGTTWKLASTALRVGGDPAPLRLKDGTFLIIATGPPRMKAERPPWLPQPREAPQPPTPQPRRPSYVL